MKMKRTKIKQAGSVLLEALIAILIFSIGVLGLVGLQSTAIGSAADAKYRSDANFLVDQMIGTAWSTRVGTTVANASNVMAAAPDPTLPCAPCTGANGNANTQTWANNVAAALPLGTGTIAINGAAVTVMVTWQPPKATTPHRHVAVTYVD